MAWHLGCPLSQTLFSSVYVEALLEPSNVVNGDGFRCTDGKSDPLLAALCAYCYGVVKTTGRIVELVRSTRYFEVDRYWNGRLWFFFFLVVTRLC
jgi:hypothetical protein